jgi:hypothetical protein
VVMCLGRAAHWLPGWAVFPQIGRCFVTRSQNLRTPLQALPLRRPCTERAPGARAFCMGQRGDETPESECPADGARRGATARRTVAAPGGGQPVLRRDRTFVPRHVRPDLRTTAIFRSGNRSARGPSGDTVFGGVSPAAAVATAHSRNSVDCELFARPVCRDTLRRIVR